MRTHIINAVHKIICSCPGQTSSNEDVNELGDQTLVKNIDA